MNEHLWDADAKAYIDSIHYDGKRSVVFSQQTQAAALLAEVPVGARRNRCLSLIENPPADFVTAGSPFFMFFMLEILAREERWDALIDCISQYWGGQIDAGATTFWEMYHPNAPRITRSHCHGWSAAPAFFLSRYILGVHPTKPGYAAVRVAPRGSLAWCRGTVPTPRGRIECAWERKDDGVRIDVYSPASIQVIIDQLGIVSHKLEHRQNTIHHSVFGYYDNTKEKLRRIV